jgi:molybdopterin/thiamine biosynthesis adenylyltransferase
MTTRAQPEEIKPRLFITSRAEDAASLSALKKEHNPHVIDAYESLLEELYVIEHPELKEHPAQRTQAVQAYIQKRKETATDLSRDGVWVYYPWKNRLVHSLTEEEYYAVRTARNHNLVTREEQEKLRNFKVGIVGLSVGQASALTLAISGMCDQMKLMDPDIIEASNLNRIHASLDAIGLHKTTYVAQKIFDTNPFAKLELYTEPLTEDNLEIFLQEPYPVDAVIDAFDDIKMKIKLRLKARDFGIPVVMATDLGDGAIIDIERYDLDPQTKIFNGRVDEKVIENLPSEMKYEDIAQIAMKMIGPENVPQRMVESLKLVGKELAGHPQLALASFLGGAIMAYTIKRIALGKELSSERLYIQFEKLL